jgi:transcriptional regulator with XRE-family HTH domain
VYVTVDSGSSVPRRQLGRYLKQYREQAGITLEEASRRLQWSKAKMYRIEAGLVPLRTFDVLAMCQVYQVPQDMTDVLGNLALETKAKGWWHSYGDAMPDWFELYVGMEAAAAKLRHFEPSLVPGLLQTREYAAAVFRAMPSNQQADIDRLVEIRLERQRLLSRRHPRPPVLQVFMDESVLRRPIVDRDGMRAQLEHLRGIQLARNSVELRILPLDGGPHAASETGAFVILDFPDVVPQEPTTIYSEGLCGALYLEKPQEVNTYETVWTALNGSVLNKTETVGLLDSILEREYAHA